MMLFDRQYCLWTFLSNYVPTYFLLRKTEKNAKRYVFESLWTFYSRLRTYSFKCGTRKNILGREKSFLIRQLIQRLNNWYELGIGIRLNFGNGLRRVEVIRNISTYFRKNDLKSSKSFIKKHNFEQVIKSFIKIILKTDFIPHGMKFQLR